jgi:hypothetical protein
MRDFLYRPLISSKFVAVPDTSAAKSNEHHHGSPQPIARSLGSKNRQPVDFYAATADRALQAIFF